MYAKTCLTHHAKRNLYMYAKTCLTHHAKRNHMGIAKRIDSGQPAQSAQSDHSRNFSPLAEFLCIR